MTSDRVDGTDWAETQRHEGSGLPVEGGYVPTCSCGWREEQPYSTEVRAVAQAGHHASMANHIEWRQENDRQRQTAVLQDLADGLADEGVDLWKNDTEGAIMTDTTTPDEFAAALATMVSSALAQAASDRAHFAGIVKLIDAGNAHLARQLAFQAAGLDRTPPLAADSIRCAVDAALPRAGHDAGEQGGMG